MNSESQAIEFGTEQTGVLSPSMTIRRLRRGFLAVVALQDMPFDHEEFATADAEEVADIARDWALAGVVSEDAGARPGELRDAARGVLAAYGLMSRPKGAGAGQLDASIIALGKAIGFESYRPEKGPDYGAAGVPSDEDSGLSEASDA